MAPGRASPSSAPITLPAVLQSLPAFQGDVAACAAREGIAPERAAKLALALEEIFVNICRYAYPNVDGTVTFRCGIDGDDFVVEIVDHGQPFDPSAVPDPDLAADLDARPIGGLGWYLAHRLVDSLQYCRDDGRNIIRLALRRQQGRSK